MYQQTRLSVMTSILPLRTLCMLLHEYLDRNPLSGRNQMSQGYRNQSQLPRPQNRRIYKNYNPPRRDWGRQENSYPENTKFHSEGERPPGPPSQGNQRCQGKESVSQPCTKQTDNLIRV